VVVAPRRGELAGVRGGAAACSGVWEWGVSEKASGEAFWGTCSAAARENSRAEALCWPSHGGVAVAAAWARRGGVARGGGSSARGQWVQGSRGVTRGAVAKLELSCGRPRAAGGAATRQRRASREADRGRGKRAIL